MCQSGFVNSKLFESLGGLVEGGYWTFTKIFLGLNISKNWAHPHFLEGRILKHNIYQRSNPDRSMKQNYFIFLMNLVETNKFVFIFL